MQGATASLRAEAGGRLAALARERPEWRGWLRLLAAVDDAGQAGGREGLRPIELSAGAVAGVGAPLLHGCSIAIDIDRPVRLLRRLASLAAAGGMGGGAALAGFQPSGTEAIELLQRAIGQGTSGAATDTGDHDAAAVHALAELAVRPLLRACTELLEKQAPAHWPYGYCPICAAWPVLVEIRGLDRARWARCGRCGGQWRGEWLRCIYCGEREHDRLGSLMPGDGGEILKIETCDTCQGYVKAVTTLQAQSPLELLLRDLETVELDLVALDRGYRRPPPGFHPAVRLVARSA
jgi:FdhE protein